MKTPLLFSLCISILLTLSTTSQAAKIDGLVAKKAALIEKMHKKAKKAIINAAKDKTFTAYFHEHEHSKKSALKEKIESISLHVQSKFAVEEMCLIDANGPELTRIVGREIASDLSPDESGAIFFAPGLSLGENEGYVSPIYYSPDAKRLVVAYVTPIITSHKNVAMLHYEHGLDAYQKTLNKKLPGKTVMLAINQEGYIVSDSRKAINIEGKSEEVSDYLETLDSLEDIKKKIETGQAVEMDGKIYQGAYKETEHWVIIGLEEK